MRAATLAASCVETFLPALCLACREPLPASARGLCAACWSRVVPDHGARCPRCGRSSVDETGPCLQCREAPPPQAATVVWGEHDGLLRRTVLWAKHGGRDELAVPLAERLTGLIGGVSWRRRIEVVTSVPSHPIRRLRRGVVLSELVGRCVAKRLGVPWKPLLRRLGLKRQAGRSRSARRALGTRVFRARGSVSGQAVLLIDDVVTTGTTLERATKVLARAGARDVYCAALAAAPDPRRLG